MILLSNLLIFNIIWTAKQMHAEFNYKYFIGAYRQLTATLILLLILSTFEIIKIKLNPNKYMHSSAISIFIGAYWQLTAMLILLSILLFFDMWLNLWKGVLSLSMVVLNSRDWQGKLWLLEKTCPKKALTTWKLDIDLFVER